MSKISLSKAGKIAGLMVLLVIVSFPMNSISSEKKNIYVDADASGKQNGSSKHPYKTIKQAIKAANGKTEIHVANGEYKEHFTLEEDIELSGESRDKTIIKGNSDNKAVVIMEDDSEINGVTIRSGQYGIFVEEKAEVSVYDCVIKDNDKDGIKIDGGYKSGENVVISKSEIRSNGRAGIYSKNRKLVIVDNEIKNNHTDGITLDSGVKAWIYGNSVRENRGSGLKLTIDGSDIWSKNNSVRYNKREGFEVASFGAAGRINIEKTKIFDNDRYGIARIQRSGTINTSAWNGQLTYAGLPNEFSANTLGTISSIIPVR